ncbi:MAG: winged helix-turn-helix transcriptional regulator [Holdemanella sp.]|nr:winged helix-turn-helix transcriptional regulator [Holdemanella sp.]
MGNFISISFDKDAAYKALDENEQLCLNVVDYDDESVCYVITDEKKNSQKVAEKVVRYYRDILEMQDTILEKETFYTSGNLVYSPENKTVYVSGKEIKLDRNQIMILHMLITNPHRIYSADTIAEILDKTALYCAKEDAVRAEIKRLRAKLDPNNKRYYIETRTKIGYKWKQPVEKKVM